VVAGGWIHGVVTERLLAFCPVARQSAIAAETSGQRHRLLGAKRHSELSKPPHAKASISA
jgi:hypothetical protein